MRSSDFYGIENTLDSLSIAIDCEPNVSSSDVEVKEYGIGINSHVACYI